MNLKYIYNRQTLKLISVLRGGQASDFRATAENVRPFVAGNNRYFKLNLYPIAFKDTSHAKWLTGFSEITGFARKEDYIEWCRANRFPVLRQWAEKYHPKLIICFGKTYIDDFKLAFVGNKCPHEQALLCGKELSWFRANFHTLVAVCPFPVNRYGLNSNASLQAFGDKLRALSDHEHDGNALIGIE